MSSITPSSDIYYFNFVHQIKVPGKLPIDSIYLPVTAPTNATTVEVRNLIAKLLHKPVDEVHLLVEKTRLDLREVTVFMNNPDPLTVPFRASVYPDDRKPFIETDHRMDLSRLYIHLGVIKGNELKRHPFIVEVEGYEWPKASSPAAPIPPTMAPIAPAAPAALSVVPTPVESKVKETPTLATIKPVSVGAPVRKARTYVPAAVLTARMYAAVNGK